MLIKTEKVITTGNRIPVTIEIKRVDQDTLIRYQTQDIKERNNWCTRNNPCINYNIKPCCPPKAPLFNHLKPHKFVYLDMVQISTNDYYYKAYPNIGKSKSWAYLGMEGAHKMTCNISNKIVNAFSGQIFRVGECPGCEYNKTGKCKRFAPSLQATGINVVSIAKEVFGIDITWKDDKNEIIPLMVAVGAIYTDEVIPISKFEEAIYNSVCSSE